MIAKTEISMITKTKISIVFAILAGLVGTHHGTGNNRVLNNAEK